MVRKGLVLVRVLEVLVRKSIDDVAAWAHIGSRLRFTRSLSSTAIVP